MCTHVGIFGFEVYHEYMIKYMKAVEHNSQTFKVDFDTFSVFQTVTGHTVAPPSRNGITNEGHIFRPPQL